jgi:hypothetical protein
MLTKMTIFQLSICVCALALLSACAKPEEQTTPEAPAEITQPILPPAEPVSIDHGIKLPTPKTAEVQDAISRIYKNTVSVVDTNQFIVGDFNGDGSQDIAVVVKPVMGKLSEINSEVANWILEVPQKIPLPDPTKATQQFPPAPPPVRVELSDTLIAILHGAGQNGWRAPDAIQTYLLKNAAGKNMLQQQAKSFFNKDVKLAKNFPQLKGDVIQETLDGKPGFLYYTGAKYVWYGTDSR